MQSRQMMMVRNRWSVAGRRSTAALTSASASASLAIPFVPSRSIHQSTTQQAPLNQTQATGNGKQQHLYVWGGGHSWRPSVSGLFGFLRPSKPSSSSSSSPLLSLRLRPSFVSSPDGSPIVDISFGHHHGAFVTANGNVFTFGSGKRHELGLGKAMEWVEEPRQVLDLPKCVSVRCGQHHTLFLSADGEVLSCGRGGSLSWDSTLGQGHKNASPTPALVKIPDAPSEKVAQIAAGTKHSVLLGQSGRLWTFGNGDHGRLGTGSSSGSLTPVALVSLHDRRMTFIGAGSSFNGALDEFGNVWVWGRNERHQCGTGPSVSMDQYAMEVVPARVEFPEEEREGERVQIKSLACGYKHMLAVSKQGRLYTWGQGRYITPHLMSGDDGWLLNSPMTQVGGGDNFSAATNEDGLLWTWGAGKSGCLGNGDTLNKKEPMAVRGFGPDVKRAGVTDAAPDYFGKVVKILAGHNHCAVLTLK